MGTTAGSQCSRIAPMKNTILTAVLLTTALWSAMAADKIKMSEPVQTERIKELVGLETQEVVAKLKRKPYLSYMELLDDDKTQTLVWSFLLKDCDKCGEWVALHPNDKTQVFWLPSEKCSHREVVVGNKNYFRMTIEFRRVGNSWVSGRAEYEYTIRN